MNMKECDNENNRPLKYRTNQSHVKLVRFNRVMGLVLLSALVPLLSPGALAQTPSLDKSRRSPFINRIILTGNKSFSDKELKKQMHTKEPSFFAIFRKPRLKSDYIRRDIGVLEAYYHTRGYFEATVELLKLEYLEEGRFADIHIKIEEGRATRVSGVFFSGQAVLKSSELRQGTGLKPGQPFNPSLLDSDIYLLKTRFFDLGYLAVTVEDSVLYSDYSAEIHYCIDPGPVIDIRNIGIHGNRLTRNKIIEEELTFEPGQTFKLSQLLEAQRNLYETGLFTEVDMLPEHLDTTLKQVDISVHVRERKSAYFEAGIGVGNILGSRVVGEWGDRNLFGLGRALILKSEYSFGMFEDNELAMNKFKVSTRYYRYDGEFQQRRFLGRKILLSFNAFYEKDATVEPLTFWTVGLSASTRRRISRYLDMLVSLSHERIKREIPATLNEKSTTRILTASLVFDKRDFIINPKRGVYRSLRLQFAGGPLAGDNDFYTLGGVIQKYVNTRETVLALRIRSGYADAFGASKDLGVPIENRYFVGGGNSIRGYPEAGLGPVEDPGGVPSTFLGGTNIGGRVLLLTNAEWRFPLINRRRLRFDGAFFLDGGNVWSGLKSIKLENFRLTAKKDEVVQQDYRYSFGFGLRYNTPVGPIRLDYGIPIKKEPGLDYTGRYHISLGHIF